ncbi:MAG: hypothetical protein RIC95_09370 [Vicingaceae bacterium]
MSKQKKFTNKIGTFNNVKGITEPESHNLPRDKRGRKELDEGFDSIYEYNKLDNLIRKTQNEFSKVISKKIDKQEFKQINLGLEDYVNSSNKLTDNLLILKKSILNCYGNNLVKDRYEESNQGTKQIINSNYFEDSIELNSESVKLISPNSIKSYKKLAAEYTENTLIKFFNHTEQDDIDSASIYRGIGNVKYAKNKPCNNRGDFISTFTGVDTPIPYFEPKLLNSYTLNKRVAEKFMISKNNTRKTLIEVDWKCLMPNIFSSFIVSNIFDYFQNEFLCLPNNNDLYISEDVNDCISADFHISESNERVEKLRRKKFDQGE